MLGIAAAGTLPAAAVVAEVSARVDLVEAAIAAVPTALVLGVGAVAASTAARRRAALRLDQTGGQRLAWLGRTLGGLGMYVAATVALALGFYGLLSLFAS